MSKDPYFENDRNARTSRQMQGLAGVLVFGGCGFAIGSAMDMVWLGFVGIVVGLLLGMVLTGLYGGRSVR
jgi:hypothetical protein